MSDLERLIVVGLCVPSLAQPGFEPRISGSRIEHFMSLTLSLYFFIAVQIAQVT